MCSLKVLLPITLALSVLALAYGGAIFNRFQLSIIHMNDFHARFEEINSKSLPCTIKDQECFGGFSRLYSEIHKLKDLYPNSLVLDAGDSFQGTLWYTIYKWKAIQYFMNKIPFDAHTLGNHEFDDKIAGVVPFLEGLKAPAVISNVDDREEPTLQGLYKKSVVIERDGFRIGIIGVITSTTKEISNTEKLNFLDELESVNKEAIRLVSEENVDTIIVLSHCGYEMDKMIAKNAAPKIGLIVGGHSHSLLYTGTPPNNLEAEGEYPTVIFHDDGRKVLVVQALAFTYFLGHILVSYNSNGDVLSWSGAPIYLNDSISRDEAINKELAEWKKAIEEYENTVVGYTLVHLEATFCRTSECNLGSFLADSMVYNYMNMETNNNIALIEPVIGLINSGAIRNSIKPGEITLGRLLEVQPFQNTFDTAELQGKYIKEALEHSAKPASMFGRGVLQVSGINVVFNITNEVGSRVQSLKVRCEHCSKPIYIDIDMEQYYRIVCNSFLMSGKDGFDMIPNNIINHAVGEVDSEVVARFISQESPITQSRDGRITIVS